MKKELFLLIAFLTLSTIGHSINKYAFTVYKTDSKIIYGICFTAKGGALGIADNNTIKVYSTKENILLNEFKNGHKRQILAIDISKDSTLLVSGGKDSTIVIWDFVNNMLSKTLSFQKGIITTVQISPDKRHLISGGTDNKVFLYDLEKNELIHVFSDHSDDVTSVKFSPDGELIATASGDGIINIYSTKDFNLITSLRGHGSWVRGLSFSRDSAKLFSCGDDSRIIRWNISKLDKISIEESKRTGYNWLLSVDLNDDSETYATGGIDGKIRIVTNIGEYTTEIGTPINNVLFKPNEEKSLKVVIATRGKGVILVDARDM